MTFRNLGKRRNLPHIKLKTYILEESLETEEKGLDATDGSQLNPAPELDPQAQRGRWG